MSVKTFDTRPAGIDASWVVYNAPRPLYGTKLWTGRFLTGIFYAAINPLDPVAQDDITEDERSGARVVEYIDKDSYARKARGKIVVEYEEMANEVRQYTDDEIIDMYPLNNEW